jgi:cytochrome b subunit of formate dehydrogenase
MNTKSVVRHSLVVRLNHWLVAVSGLLLVFSGFGQMPMYARYNLVKVPLFGWSGDFGLNLIIHYVAAAVFMATVFFHGVYHLRRREWSAWPQKGDVRESVHIIRAMLTGKPEPPHGKFLAEQRLAYVAIAATIALLVITGLIKTWKNMGAIVLHPGFLQTVTLLHTLATMVFLGLVAAHVAAFLLKANRPLLPSMMTGCVPCDYVKKRHPLWVEELQSQSEAGRVAPCQEAPEEPREDPEQNKEKIAA